MRLRGNCFIMLLSGLLDNDTPHCKGGGGETGRKNGFSVIGNIKTIHAGRRGERSEGWMCKALRSGFLLTQVECGCGRTPCLTERQRDSECPDIRWEGKKEQPLLICNKD